MSASTSLLTPTLSTARLRLRPAALSDAPAVQRHFGRWEIIRHLSVRVPWPYPAGAAEAWLRDLMLPCVERGEIMLWAITLSDGDGEAIGLLEWDRDVESVENRGFWLAQEYQGRGLMTEAVTAFQDWVFFEQGVERLFVCNARNNPGSRRVKEKTGARLVGLMELEHHSGETVAERWVVTREAWALIRGRSL